MSFLKRFMNSDETPSHIKRTRKMPFFELDSYESNELEVYPINGSRFESNISSSESNGRQFKILSKSKNIRTINVSNRLVELNDPHFIGYRATVLGKLVNSEGERREVKHKLFLEPIDKDIRSVEAALKIANNINFSKLLREFCKNKGEEILFAKYTPVLQEGETVGLLMQSTEKGAVNLYTYLKNNDEYIRDNSAKIFNSTLKAGQLMEEAGVYHRGINSESIFIVGQDVLVGNFCHAIDEMNSKILYGDIAFLPGDLVIANYQNSLIPPLCEQKIDSFALGLVLFQMLKRELYHENDYLSVIQVFDKWLLYFDGTKLASELQRFEDDLKGFFMINGRDLIFDTMKLLLNHDSKKRPSLNEAFRFYQESSKKFLEVFEVKQERSEIN